jgi:hypothetical protein
MNLLKVRGKKSKNYLISIFGVEYVCSHKYRRLIKRFALHILGLIVRFGSIFIGMVAIFFYIFLWMIATWAT